MWLVGGIEPKLMRSAKDQQGLLQLHADFSFCSAAEAASKILQQK
jgi:hypothetical protein